MLMISSSLSLSRRHQHNQHRDRNRHVTTMGYRPLFNNNNNDNNNDNHDDNDNDNNEEITNRDSSSSLSTSSSSSSSSSSSKKTPKTVKDRLQNLRQWLQMKPKNAESSDTTTTTTTTSSTATTTTTTDTNDNNSNDTTNDNTHEKQRRERMTMTTDETTTTTTTTAIHHNHNNNSNNNNDDESTIETTLLSSLPSASSLPTMNTTNMNNMDPVATQNAQKWLAEAEKVRLEAARMDAELTLKKIARLEKELAQTMAMTTTTSTSTTATTTTNNKMDDDKKRRQEKIDDIQRQMKVLQSRLEGDGEEVELVRRRNNNTPQPSIQAMNSSMSDEPRFYANEIESDLLIPYSEERFQELLQTTEEMPSFALKALAIQLGYEFDKLDDINRTEVAVRLDKMVRFDFSYSKRPRPSFTQRQIDDRTKDN